VLLTERRLAVCHTGIARHRGREEGSEPEEALSTAANEGNSVGHANYCKRVGLEELFRTCSRTVQDAVAMNMITDPQAFNDIMNLQIEVNVRSRLRHAYFIQKRLLKDIGQQLVIMGSESENAEGSNGEESAKQPPTGSTPEPPPAVSGGAPGLGLVTGSPESDALMHSTFSAMGGGYPSLPPTHSTPFDPQFWGSNPFGSSLTAAMVAQGLGIPPQDYGCPFPAVPPYLDPYASPLPPQLSSSSVGSNNKVGRRVSNNSSNKMMQSSPPTSALSTSDPDGPAYVDVKWDTSLGAPPNLTRMEDEKLPPARTDGSFLLDDAS